VLILFTAGGRTGLLFDAEVGDNMILQATLFISALNTTIIATAVPVITHELDSARGYAWIGASYTM
jgi:hypothetical protein